MCGTPFSPLTLRTVVPPSEVIEETIPADQAPLVLAAMTEWDMGGGVSDSTTGFDAVPPVAVTLMV